MMLREILVVLLASVASCAISSTDCSLMTTRSEWYRLDSPPSFVTATTYQEMYPRVAPPHPDKFIWYKESSGRYAACVPGNRHGCGAVVSYFSDNRLEEISEIVVCADH